MNGHLRRCRFGIPCCATQRARSHVRLSTLRGEAVFEDGVKLAFVAFLWRTTVAVLAVDVSSMLDAKDRDFAALVVDRIEDSVITLPDAVGFGLSVELFGLPRSGVGCQA